MIGWFEGEILGGWRGCIRGGRGEVRVGVGMVVGVGIRSVLWVGWGEGGGGWEVEGEGIYVFYWGTCGFEFGRGSWG